MRTMSGILLGAFWLVMPAGASAETNAASMAEIIGVLRSRYVDRDTLDEQRLNDAAVAGILQALGRGATLIAPTAIAPPSRASTTGELARAEVIDPEIGYMRIADVVEQTPAAIDAELRKFSDAKVTGYILDLRFADGSNFTAAAAVAGRFLSDGQTLFALKTVNGGERIFQASPPSFKPLSEAPLLVLVNAETTGSAEALAGALRAQGRAILVGATTAGAPAAWEEIRLSDGRLLRVASAKILLPAEEAATAMKTSVFPDGLAPDVPVRVNMDLEREAVLHARTNMTLTASLQPAESRKRLTEAELVRAFRGEALDLRTGVSTNTTMRILPEGTLPAETPQTDAEAVEPSPNKRDAAPPVDQVLQRAVDILKGIRVLLSSR